MCLEVGSRKDIVTDMNVESIPMVETKTIHYLLSHFLFSY